MAVVRRLYPRTKRGYNPLITLLSYFAQHCVLQLLNLLLIITISSELVAEKRRDKNETILHLHHLYLPIPVRNSYDDYDGEGSGRQNRRSNRQMG